MNKAVFLDRDGTINVEKHYLHRIEDFEFLPGVIEGLKLLQEDGFMLIIVTNQSGIGRGYYTEEDFHSLNRWMLDTLKAQGITITHVYYCPHLPDATVEAYRKECTCRKPQVGMYMQAVQDYGISLENSFVIGDKIRDCAICKSTLCQGYLIGTNENPVVIQEVKKNEYTRTKYAEDLLAAAKNITGKYNL